jgi:hypothetical protein
MGCDRAVVGGECELRLHHGGQQQCHSQQAGLNQAAFGFHLTGGVDGIGTGHVQTGAMVQVTGDNPSTRRILFASIASDTTECDPCPHDLRPPLKHCDPTASIVFSK